MTGVQTCALPIWSIRRLPKPDGWEVTDACEQREGGAPHEFQVRWQFVPGSRVKRISDRKYSVHRADVALVIELGEDWTEVELGEPVGNGVPSLPARSPADSLEGMVSPAFRKICWAPYLKLTARPQGNRPCVFSTAFYPPQIEVNPVSMSRHSAPAAPPPS